MKSLQVITTVLLTLGSAALAADKPNIVLILADDMGYADPACFGGTTVPTPHLDTLARSGTRMTRFYAASAVCTPTRASIMTGRYPLRFDIRQHFTDEGDRHLPRGVVTLPKLLRDAGYATAHVGKWHLGGLNLAHARDRAHSIPGPREHGFEHYLCQIEEQPMRGEMGAKRRLYRDGGTCLLRNDVPVPEDDPYHRMHFTDIIGQEAVRLVEQYHKEGRPFFLNVWHLVPHTPFEPGSEPHYRNTAAPGISEDQHCFRSMVAHLDATMGELLAKLDKLGIRDNTLVVFTSDNGGAWEADNGPFKGGKTDLHEGGIRVPMIVSWPKRIRAGKTSDAVAGTVDLLPTFCAAASVTVPKAAHGDGISLLPHLTTGANLANRPPLLWQLDLYPSMQRRDPRPKPYATEAIVDGQWKLLTRDAQPLELFDLQADVGETQNLLARHPDVAAKLAADIRDFLKSPRDRSGFPEAGTPKSSRPPECVAELNQLLADASRRDHDTKVFNSAESGAADARSFLETGLPLFTNHNAVRRHYRLPSLLVSSNGTVIAVSQLRWGPDDFAPQELVCRRSEDGGRTWGPEISIRRDPDRKHCRFNGCIVEDAEAGKLILHFLEFPTDQGRRWFQDVLFARGGGHCQTESTDDGQTWSEPVLQIPLANADGWKGASSLNNNHGVQLQHGPHRGLLVMNARVFQPGLTTWRAKGGIVYSDDHGRTWQIGGVPFPDQQQRYATESCLVETAGGGIYVNYRNEVGGENQPRLSHRSEDGGTTVSKQAQHDDLPAMVCNAGMTRYSWPPRNIILLTMPAAAGRRDLTCFASFDDGRTWPVRRRIASDGGYSDVAVLSDGTILVAYEPDGARKGIVLARFNLAWLMETPR